MIYSFFIFSPSGLCLYSKEFPQKVQTVPSATPDKLKLMMGLVYNMRSFVTRINPKGNPNCTLHCYSTKDYKLHFFETVTNLRFVIISDPSTPDLRQTLVAIYRDYYVEYVLKNAFYTPGDEIKSELFETKLTEYMERLPSYS